MSAIQRNQPTALFDALLLGFQYQGISDAVARNYLRSHGSATWSSISKDLASNCLCPHLANFDRLSQCRYDKLSLTCAEPDLIDSCPLPRYRLRNGRLNCTAFSFYLFVRDVAGGNLITWIDRQITQSNEENAQASVIAPLRSIYGISDKILTMAFSTLFLGLAEVRPRWFESGLAMVTVDTLVHNWLHRSGILEQMSFAHAYGPLCYAPGGCVDVIRRISAEIDATQFNSNFPVDFARWIQHSLWRFCASDELDVCNGNRIDDRHPCANRFCQITGSCQKKPLKLSNS